MKSSQNKNNLIPIQTKANVSKRKRAKKMSEKMSMCLSCHVNINTSNIREHYMGWKHGDKSSTLYGNSPTIDVVGLNSVAFVDVKKYFESNFGEVKSINISPVCAQILQVTFNKAEDAKLLTSIKTPIFYKNNKLFISAAPANGNMKTTTNPASNNVTPMPNMQKAKIKPAFPAMCLIEATNMSLPGDFDSQLVALMAYIRLKPKDMETFRNVCSDLQLALSRCFTGCQVLPFGSVTTGLGFVGSDLDCYGYLPNIDYEENENLIFKKAKREFYSNRNIFSDIVPIPRTKVPIIKLKHSSGVRIDINFKSPHGMLNSEMIRCFLKSDERILPLAIFIKYWAKSMRLLNNDRSGFTSYGMTLLVIYYLQKLSTPILPSLLSLQSDPQFDKPVGVWNAGFNEKGIPRNNNTLSILSLIEGFFEFYSDFKFKDTVICPFIADSVPVKDFEKLTNLPPAYDNFVKLVTDKRIPNLAKSSITLQDPIELNVNAARAVSLYVMEDFADECYNSMCIIKKSLSKNIETNLIMKLTNFCKVVPNLDLKEPMTFYVPFNLAPAIITVDILKNITEKFVNLLKKTTISILTDILRCSYSSEVKSLALDCTVSYDLWTGRDSFRKFDGVHCLKDECDISETMFKQRMREPFADPMTFKMVIGANVHKSFCKIDITPLHCNEGFRDFLELFLFLFEYEARHLVY